jgi:hypothetical protein
MPRYINGLPVDTGASDSQDSARLAGMMAIAGLANYCELYVVEGKGRRHPTDSFQGANNPDKFSRDQLMCLIAGLGEFPSRELLAAAHTAGNRAQNWMEDNGKAKWYGADRLTTLNMQVLEIRAGERAKLSLFARMQLAAELTLKRVFTPLGEPNQLISMCYVSGNLSMLDRLWPQWELAVVEYWCGWRGEPELAHALIRAIK